MYNFGYAKQRKKQIEPDHSLGRHDYFPGYYGLASIESGMERSLGDDQPVSLVAIGFGDGAGFRFAFRDLLQVEDPAFGSERKNLSKRNLEAYFCRAVRV